MWAFVACALLVHTLCARSQQIADNEAEILWDTWGVPHIFADNLPAGVYGSGYAQARLHGNLLLQLFATSRGQSAEYFGEDFVETDRLVWSFEIPSIGARLFEESTEQELDVLEAYAAGFNDYINANENEFDAVRRQVLPITALDVYLHQFFQFVQFSFVRNSRSATLNEGAGLLSKEQKTFSLDDSDVFAHDLDYSDPFGLGGDDDPRTEMSGSNVWAINGDKSDGNGAKLVQNPHLPYAGFFRWMEIHVNVANEDLNIYGAGLVGNPLPAIAFTDYLGWSHTVNVVQNFVTYRVSLINETHYQYNDDELPLESTTYTFRVLTADGLQNSSITLERTIHGPVFQKSSNFLLASRWGGAAERAHALDQRIAMYRAKNLDEFRDAMRQLQFGFFHTCGATKDGDIFNYFNAYVPKRDDSLGDWFYWREPVDGSTNATFFDDIHPFEDLPAVENPSNNFVQNANEPPWTMTVPVVEELNPDNFPSYMSSPPYMFSRPQTSVRLMTENDAISFEELIELKHSTRHELANHTIDALVAAGRASSDTPANVLEALNVLEAWDRNLDAESVGALLFLVWNSVVVSSENRDPRSSERVLKPAEGDAFEDLLFSTQWNIDDPLNTPTGLSNAARELAALGTALTIMETQFTNLSPLNISTPYGEVFRLQDPTTADPSATLPGHGGAETFRNTQWVFGADFQVTTPSFNGDGWVCVVEFTPNGPRAKSLLGYGNGSQGKHVNDQWQLYANKQLRDVWLNYTIIEQNLDSRVTLTYPAGDGDSDSDSDSDGDGDGQGANAAAALLTNFSQMVSIASAIMIAFVC